MDVQQRIDRLGRELDEFRIEFEKFLHGARAVPPEELRAMIVSGLRDVRGASLKAVADNFRIAQLEARFNSYNELFNRRVREREEGRSASRGVEGAGEVPDARRGVVLGERLQEEAVEVLYRGLQRGPGSGPSFDLESFRAYLSRQVSAIRSRTGCDRVQFRLATEDGRLKLKAKPIPGPSAPSP